MKAGPTNDEVGSTFARVAKGGRVCRVAKVSRVCRLALILGVETSNNSGRQVSFRRS